MDSSEELGESTSLLANRLANEAAAPSGWKRRVLVVGAVALAAALGVVATRPSNNARVPVLATKEHFSGGYRSAEDTQVPVLATKLHFSSKAFKGAEDTQVPVLALTSSGDGDDGTEGTNVTMMIRGYGDLADCQNHSAAIMDSYHEETFTLGVCSYYKTYNDTASAGKVEEYSSYVATCANNYLTVTRYRDEACTEEAESSDGLTYNSETCRFLSFLVRRFSANSQI